MTPLKGINLLLAAIGVFALTACDDYKGSIEVTSDFKVLLGSKEVNIPVGNYKLRVGMSKGNLEIKLPGFRGLQKTKHAQGHKGPRRKVDQPVKFKLPQSFSLSGNIDIPAETSGQPVSLVGRVDDSSYSSGTYSGQESCTWSEEVYQCRYDSEKEKRICETVTIYHSGSQYVEYYYYYTIKDIYGDLREPGSNSSVAELAAHFRDEDKNYTHVGECN